MCRKIKQANLNLSVKREIPVLFYRNSLSVRIDINRLRVANANPRNSINIQIKGVKIDNCIGPIIHFRYKMYHIKISLT